MSPVPRIDLPVNVVANVVPKAAEQVVMLGFHVGRNYLTLPAAGADQTAAYEIVAWVFAAGQDKAVGVIRHTTTLDLVKEPQALEKLKTKGFVFVPGQPLTLPPGLYQIRVAMREKTSGAVGTAYQFFEVPNLKSTNTVSMSSIVMAPAGQLGFSGSYSFKPGAEIDLGYVIYNLPKRVEGITQTIKLIDSKGKMLLTSSLFLSPGATQESAPQGTRLNAPPARGRYAIIVELQDTKGKIDIERRADFVVE
jgi:hypothetical protein